MTSISPLHGEASLRTDVSGKFFAATCATRELLRNTTGMPREGSVEDLTWRVASG